MNLRSTEESIVDEMLREVKQAKDADGQPLFKSYSYAPLTRIRTLIESVARAIYLFADRELLAIQKAIHPHTASKEDLYEWLRRYGMSWKEAHPARHTIRIGSSEPVYYSAAIPQGTIVTTDAPDRAKVKFKTLQAATLPAGQVGDGIVYPDGKEHYTVAVQVECIDAGVVGNVAPYAIKLFEHAPEGVDFVCNTQAHPDVQGTPQESIAQVRDRLKTAEQANTTMWTPDWYRKQAEAHPNVARAVFKSSRDLGIPGTVKLFLLGRSGALTSQELRAVADDLDQDIKNPGGCARVLVANFTTVEVNKIVTVQFPDLISIPAQSVLDDMWGRYFASIGEQENVTEGAIRAVYLALPRVVSVIIHPAGDVIVPAGSVAIPGRQWSVVAEVYGGT